MAKTVQTDHSYARPVSAEPVVGQGYPLLTSNVRGANRGDRHSGSSEPDQYLLMCDLDKLILPASVSPFENWGPYYLILDCTN